VYIYTAEANMKGMMKYSRREYDQYKSSKNQIYLQQACEKLFSALNNYIEIVNNTRISGAPDVKRLVVKEKSLAELYYDCLGLHRYFYTGDYDVDVGFIESKYLESYKKLQQRIMRLG